MNHGPQAIRVVSRAAPARRLGTWHLLGAVGHLLGAVGLRSMAVQLAFAAPAAWAMLGGGWVSALVAVAMVPLWPLADAVCLRLALDESRRPGSARLRSAVRVGARRWGPLLGTYILSGVVVALLTLLCVVPGVVRAMAYLLVGPIVVSGEAGARDALRLSRERMRGSRLRVFPAALLLVLPVLAAQIVANIGQNLLRWELLGAWVGSADALQLRAVQVGGLLAARVLLVPALVLPVAVASELRSGD